MVKASFNNTKLYPIKAIEENLERKDDEETHVSTKMQLEPSSGPLLDLASLHSPILCGPRIPYFLILNENSIYGHSTVYC